MRNQRPTPKHVIFSESLLAVPKLPMRLGAIDWPWGGELIAEAGNWTDAGAVIAKFQVRPLLGLGPRFGEIRSPIPGRIVTIASIPFGYPSDSREFTKFYFTIEVPKGVTFCSAVERQQTYLFGKRWQRGDPKPSEEEIYTMLNGLRNSVPVLISKKESNSQEIIDSLNFRYPHGIGQGGG